MSRTEDRLRRLARTWDSFGRSDPLWAVLTEPSKRGRKWEPAAFFATGEYEIAATEALLSEHGLTPKRNLPWTSGAAPAASHVHWRLDLIVPSASTSRNP